MKQSIGTRDHMDEPQKQYTKWKKQDTDHTVCDSIYMRGAMPAKMVG